MGVETNPYNQHFRYQRRDDVCLIFFLWRARGTKLGF